MFSTPNRQQKKANERLDIGKDALSLTEIAKQGLDNGDISPEEYNNLLKTQAKIQHQKPRNIREFIANPKPDDRKPHYDENPEFPNINTNNIPDLSHKGQKAGKIIHMPQVPKPNNTNNKGMKKPGEKVRIFESWEEQSQKLIRETNALLNEILNKREEITGKQLLTLNKQLKDLENLQKLTESKQITVSDEMEERISRTLNNIKELI